MSIKEKLTRLGTILDASAVFLKRTVIFIVLLFISLSVIGGLFSSEEDPFQEGAILDLNIKGELTVIFSEKKNSINNFNYLTESDKKMINKMLPKKTIKDIVDFFKERNISKRTIYNYCIKKKNEN